MSIWIYRCENVESFCVKPRRPYCSRDFYIVRDIFDNCTPVYYSTQSPQIDCHLAPRCQYTDVCIFGNLTMYHGELNQATDYNSLCVKCVCEVPPLATCRRLPDNASKIHIVLLILFSVETCDIAIAFSLQFAL